MEARLRMLVCSGISWRSRIFQCYVLVTTFKWPESTV